jgi:CRP-like cAMP-binding protein
MDELIKITIRPDEADKVKAMADKLNKLLKRRVGLVFNFRKTDGEYYLYVHLNEQRALQSLTRGAGRDLKQKPKAVTCGEVLSMLQDKSNDEVAQELGYTRATFYRRLKQMREQNDLAKPF